MVADGLSLMLIAVLTKLQKKTDLLDGANTRKTDIFLDPSPQRFSDFAERNGTYFLEAIPDDPATPF